ncbi:hypothetical protein Tsubulata_024618 [Turnera subulata]|uniref:(S)-ureidoglycine aminohydrolase cupin domain-containing protein n=1 Tax=Turnera subulata TaxID=218843 RepID=A0A9Q0J3Y6_9ROSI|nr:hypothetical protein Tsubulata_024618 [Turnera subulata]
MATTNTNTSTTITEIYGLKIEKNPPQSKLDKLGVTTWETYTGPVCKNPWTFEGRETVYMVEGKVKLHVEGYEDQEPVEIGARDLIVFPKGTKIIWEALEPVFKYFNLEKEKVGLISLLILLVSVFLCAVFITRPEPRREDLSSSPVEAESDMATTTTEIFGVKIEKNPPQSKLDELGVTTWSKYNGQPGKIPWTFEATETMYLLEGKVKVSVDGYDEPFEIGAGDLVVFPKGMKITWDVIEAVSKHYSLEK